MSSCDFNRNCFEDTEMTLYGYHPDSDHYNSILLDKKDYSITKMHFKARSLAQTWNPMAVRVYKMRKGEGDFPCLTEYYKIPVFSLRAWKALSPLLGKTVEALPIIHPFGDYVIVNVLKQTDCLDESRSVLTRNKVTGRVSRVFEYCFFWEKIDSGNHMIKLPPKSGADLLVDESFKDVIEHEKLTGLRLEAVPLVTP